MRTFICSDLHGNGDIYDSMMGYLENIPEEVELYINGDLIDRGLDSFRMLTDVIERINGKGNIKIHYLGGNHEMMMYDALKKRKPGKSISPWCDWMNNGGGIIEGELDCREDGEELCDSFRDFMGELEIYHLFDERLAGKPMVLVHAQTPKDIKKECDMKIKDDGLDVFRAVWTRKEERDPILFGIGRIIGWNRIGLDDYFTIKGHTVVSSEKGFEIDKKENYINIDGGCAGYAVGMFKYDHIPLLEIEDGLIKILVFNHNNEIEKGYLYDGDLINMSNEELNNNRAFIDHSYDNQREEYKQKILEYKRISEE